MQQKRHEMNFKTHLPTENAGVYQISAIRSVCLLLSV